MAFSVRTTSRHSLYFNYKEFQQSKRLGLERVKEELIAVIGEAVAEWQYAVQAFDEAAAAFLGTNLTDLRCLGALYRDGPATAGHLAKVAGITAGAITAAIDRLQRLGYVKRVRDAPDRRQVRIELTPLVIKRFEQIWAPLSQDSQDALRQLTESELTVFRDVLNRNLRIQRAHTQRLRQLPRRE
jgi:DNA-binding MarR family transcriptional regulator